MHTFYDATQRLILLFPSKDLKKEATKFPNKISSYSSFKMLMLFGILLSVGILPSLQGEPTQSNKNQQPAT